MIGLPDDVVIPQPNMIDREFWEHCTQRRLMFQACGSCGLLRHPPTPFCSSCQSTELEWRDAPPVAKIYSYTMSHISKEQGLTAGTCYTIAVVEFPDFGPVRLVTNVAADCLCGRWAMISSTGSNCFRTTFRFTFMLATRSAARGTPR